MEAGLGTMVALGGFGFLAGPAGWVLGVVGALFVLDGVDKVTQEEKGAQRK